MNLDDLITRLRALHAETSRESMLTEQQQRRNTAFVEALIAAWPELLRALLPTSRGDDLAERYNELLYAVAKKFPGEDRHQTALRYIRERESVSDDQAAARLRGEGR